MSAVEDREPNGSHSTLRRIADALRRRHWSTFAVELVLIIVGIIVALSIDDWIQERADRRSEKVYLASLLQDLDQIVESLQAYIDNETSVAAASAAVLERLSVEGYEQDGEALRDLLSNMGTRRTLRLVSASYADLTSTGNFQLIRSRDLREQLLRYFADVSLAELVVEKNNAIFIDNMYWSFVTRIGMTWTPTRWRELSASMRSAEEFYAGFLGPEIAYPTDVVFAQPADAETWNEIRRMCFLRLRITAIGLSFATNLIDKTEQLKSLIDAEMRDLDR